MHTRCHYLMTCEECRKEENMYRIKTRPVQAIGIIGGIIKSLFEAGIIIDFQKTFKEGVYME